MGREDIQITFQNLLKHLHSLQRLCLRLLRQQLLHRLDERREQRLESRGVLLLQNGDQVGETLEHVYSHLLSGVREEVVAESEQVSVVCLHLGARLGYHNTKDGHAQFPLSRLLADAPLLHINHKITDN